MHPQHMPQPETRRSAARRGRSTSCRSNRGVPTARRRAAAEPRRVAAIAAEAKARRARLPPRGQRAARARAGAKRDPSTAARTTSVRPRTCRASSGSPAPGGAEMARRQAPANPVRRPPARQSTALRSPVPRPPERQPTPATPRSRQASSYSARSRCWPSRSASSPAASPAVPLSQVNSSSTTRRPASPSP